jgi:hypothetical protein
MRFTYTHPTPDAGVIEAIDFVTNLAHLDGFWQAIAQAPPFKQTTATYTPTLISQRMRACTDLVTIDHYNEASSATAKVEPAVPFTIFLNDRKFRRSVASKANTLVHEFVHVVDHFRDGPTDTGRWDYGHTRSPHPDRPRSAPYWIGNLAQEWWVLAHQHDPNAFLADPLSFLKGPIKDYAGEEGFDCDTGGLPL